MPNTTNFNWPTPADTDLVKDGAAAIRNLGNGIDTSLIDLKGGTTGQILSKASNADMDFTFITPNVGDITEVQAGTGISVASGTGPIPVVTNTVATAFDAAGDLVYGTGADTFTKLSLGTAGQVLKVNSGATAPEWGAAAAAGFVGCKVKMTADLSVANNTEVTVTFGGEEFDTDAFHNNVTNNSRITIPSGKGGKYLFTAQFFMNIGDSSAFIVYTFLNGNKIGRAQARPGSTGFISIGVSDIFNLVATDYIEYVVAQTSGATQDLKATESTSLVTYAAAQYLGA